MLLFEKRGLHAHILGLLRNQRIKHTRWLTYGGVVADHKFLVLQAFGILTTVASLPPCWRLWSRLSWSGRNLKLLPDIGCVGSLFLRFKAQGDFGSILLGGINAVLVRIDS